MTRGVASRCREGPAIVVYVVALYKNGFLVNNEGPLRSLEDPENEEFLVTVRTGNVPFGTDDVRIRLVDRSSLEYEGQSRTSLEIPFLLSSSDTRDDNDTADRVAEDPLASICTRPREIVDQQQAARPRRQIQERSQLQQWSGKMYFFYWTLVFLSLAIAHQVDMSVGLFQGDIVFIVLSLICRCLIIRSCGVRDVIEGETQAPRGLSYRMEHPFAHLEDMEDEEVLLDVDQYLQASALASSKGIPYEEALTLVASAEVDEEAESAAIRPPHSTIISLGGTKL